MTIKEARKLLGKRAAPLTDEEVLEIIINLTAIARAHLLPKNVRDLTEVIGSTHD